MRTNTRGFTIIELMLAMTFLAAIMIVSSAAIVQAFGIYNKGLVIKQLNQLGRTLTEDMTRVAHSAVVTADVGEAVGTHVLCLGSTVYVWNTVKHSDTQQKEYIGGDRINLVKANSSSACNNNTTTAAQLDPADVTSLLSDNVQVLSAEVERAEGADNVVNVRFVFGTYEAADPNSSINPKETSPGSGVWRCESRGIGNYCAFGVYDTTLYLPNRGDQT